MENKKIVQNYFKDLKYELASANMNYMTKISYIFVIVVAAYTVVFLLTDKMTYLVLPYACFLPVFLLFAIFGSIYKVKRLQNPTLSRIISSMFCLNMMGFGLSLSLVNKGTPATMLPVFSIVLMMLFTFPKVLKYSLFIGFYVAALIASYFIKESSTFSTDLINGIAVLLAAYVLNHNVFALKLSDYQARKKLEEISALDELTSLPNRRMLNTFLKIHQNKKVTNHMVAAMIDVDDFKKYNDEFGHLVGDEVLVKLSSILRVFAADSNIFVSRYGGEEFVLVSFVYSLEEMKQKAKIIQSELNELDHENIYKQITISVGIAQKSLVSEEDYSACIMLADKALYRAKENGKNRIEEYHEE